MAKSKDFPEYEPTKTTEFFDKLNIFYYCTGNYGYWINDVKFHPKLIKIYNVFAFLVTVGVYIMHFLIVGALFTKQNSTKEQKDAWLMFSIMSVGGEMYIIFPMFYKKEVQQIYYTLMVELKQYYCDTQVGDDMRKSIRRFSTALVMIAMTISALNGIKVLYGVLMEGNNFVTVVVAWPTVDDPSSAAGVARVIIFLFWLIFTAQANAILSLLVSMLIGTCYQFKNLQSYFYSLEDIFKDKNLIQEEKETKFEQEFKRGIKMHSITLRCTELHQHVVKETSALTVILCGGLLMTEMMSFLSSKHTLSNIAVLAPLVMTSLLCLGFFMWNGGDITDEASKLPTAMYSSGWENCHGASSVRIRRLVTYAIAIAQKPVVYQAMGVVDLSYDAFVSVVKAAYSVVSIFY